MMIDIAKSLRSINSAYHLSRAVITAAVVTPAVTPLRGGWLGSDKTLNLKKAAVPGLAERLFHWHPDTSEDNTRWGLIHIAETIELADWVNNHYDDTYASRSAGLLPTLEEESDLRKALAAWRAASF